MFKQEFKPINPAMLHLYLVWNRLSLWQLFLLLVDCAVLVFSSRCFFGENKRDCKKRSLHLFRPTQSLRFKIRESQKFIYHILTARARAPETCRTSRPCSRKRSDMMRSARTITRFAPCRDCSRASIFHFDIRHTLKQGTSSTDGASETWIRNDKNHTKCTSFNKAPTISSAFAFTEPSVRIPRWEVRTQWSHSQE